VESGLENLDFVVVGAVDQPMFVGYPARPVSGQLTLERFRFADAADRIALDLAEKGE